MNDTLKVLEKRRSCRNFKSDMIPEETLGTDRKSRNLRTNGMGKQSPIILAVTNKELRDQLSGRKTARSWEHQKAWTRSMEPPVALLWYSANKAVPTSCV